MSQKLKEEAKKRTKETIKLEVRSVRIRKKDKKKKTNGDNNYYFSEKKLFSTAQ